MLGPHMAREMRECADVFAKAARQTVPTQPVPNAIYTFARGSSDTVANVLSYELMDRLLIPATSLPPSVFSLAGGVYFANAMALIISQSGGSSDLIACAREADRAVAITNVAGSSVEKAVDLVVPVNAGPERAVPATKTVVGSLGAGMALLAALDPNYRSECDKAAEAFASGINPLPEAEGLAKKLADARHVYVLGRRASFGAAQEVALKLKETCALHAEAYSAAEVLHGPLQLSTKPLTVLVLDAGDSASAQSLDIAEARFRNEGATVLRISPEQVGVSRLAGPAMAAALLNLVYPVVHAAANRQGLDPDSPKILKKVTSTL